MTTCADQLTGGKSQGLHSMEEAHKFYVDLNTLHTSMQEAYDMGWKAGSEFGNGGSCPLTENSEKAKEWERGKKEFFADYERRL